MQAYLSPRVKETSTTTGTGTLSLLGAVSGFQTFVSGIGNGNSCYYTIVHATAWEVGIGTVTDLATDTLSRDTILASSAGGAALNLGVGTKTVFIDVTRESIAVLGGHLFGCTIANNATDAANDIDFSAGQCSSDDAAEANRIVISPAAMTKQIDATWQAGSGRGGRLSSDALGASATWHCFAFKPAASPDDYFFSTSVNPTPPSGTKKRRIASLLKGASAWRTFIQDGDYFRHGGSVSLDYNSASTGTSAILTTLTVPTGVKMGAFGNAMLQIGAGETYVYLSDPAAADEAPSQSAYPISQLYCNSVQQNNAAPWECHTDASARIRQRCSASGVSITLRIATMGWVDRRGRDA